MANRQIDQAVLEDMAADAFEVMNWARRMGLKRPEQEREVIKAFRLTLTKAGVEFQPEPSDAR